MKKRFRWGDRLKGCGFRLTRAREAILEVIENGLALENEKVLVFSHISHVYTNGASLYITYLYRRASDPHQTLEWWRKLKTPASQKIAEVGGTITHQHGVGIDHKPFLEEEKGKLGAKILQTMIKQVDPHQVMNQGKLIDTGKRGEN